MAPDFQIPAMLSNENAPDFQPLPPEAGNGRKSGAFSLESIAGIRKSGATGFWCGCALIPNTFILLLHYIYLKTSVALDFRIPAMLFNENAADFRPLRI